MKTILNKSIRKFQKAGVIDYTKPIEFTVPAITENRDSIRSYEKSLPLEAIEKPLTPSQQAIYDAAHGTITKAEAIEWDELQRKSKTTISLGHKLTEAEKLLQKELAKLHEVLKWKEDLIKGREEAGKAAMGLLSMLNPSTYYNLYLIDNPEKLIDPNSLGGMVFDVLADPTTYASFGVLPFLKVSGKKTASKLATKTAENIATKPKIFNTFFNPESKIPTVFAPDSKATGFLKLKTLLFEPTPSMNIVSTANYNLYHAKDNSRSLKHKLDFWKTRRIPKTEDMYLPKEGKKILSFNPILTNPKLIDNLVNYFKIYDSDFTSGLEDLLRQFGPYRIYSEGNPLASKVNTGEHSIPLFGTDKVVKYKIDPLSDETRIRLSSWLGKLPQVIEHILGNKNVKLPQEYLDALQHNIDYVNAKYPGMKLYGSSAAVTKAKFPHATHDIDFLITDSLMHPDFFKGNRTRPDNILHKPATYLILLDPKYGDAGLIDANVIYTNPKTGFAEGENALEVARQFNYPEYQRASMESLLTGKPMELHITPEELFKNYDATSKTIADSFQSHKFKHVGRDFIHMLYSDPNEVRKGLSVYVESISGKPLKQNYPIEMFLDPSENLKMLKEMKKASKYMEFIPDGITNDPKRMLLLYDYYIFLNTSLGRGLSDYNIPKNLEDLYKAINKWTGEGNWNVAGGNNAVMAGDSNFGGYAYALIRPEYDASNKTPLEHLNLIHNLFYKSNTPLKPEQINGINEAIKIYNSTNPTRPVNLISGDRTLSDVLFDTRTPLANKDREFPNIYKLLDDIHKKTGIISSESRMDTSMPSIVFNNGLYNSILTELNTPNGIKADVNIFPGRYFNLEYFPKSGTALLHLLGSSKFINSLGIDEIGNLKLSNPKLSTTFNPNYDPVYDLNKKAFIKGRNKKLLSLNSELKKSKLEELNLLKILDTFDNYIKYKKLAKHNLLKTSIAGTAAGALTAGGLYLNNAINTSLPKAPKIYPKFTDKNTYKDYSMEDLELLLKIAQESKDPRKELKISVIEAVIKDRKRSKKQKK